VRQSNVCRTIFASDTPRLIAGMRDRLIQDYLGVDYDIVWDAATTNVPELSVSVRRIIEQESLSKPLV
jgi:uncharacterized protein with HEPN domain